MLAYVGFPADHWSKIHSTNGLERLNGEIKRRTDVGGIFPNEDAIVRLVGTATRATLRTLSGACANVLLVESAVRTAVPPSPTRNSRRLGSSDESSLAECVGKFPWVFED